MNRIKKTVHFEAVQVVTRNRDGWLAEWWPGDKVLSLREARATAVRLSKEHEKAEYAVLRVTTDEMPIQALSKRAAARKAAAPVEPVGNPVFSLDDLTVTLVNRVTE